jgi:hypothetical protein
VGDKPLVLTNVTTSCGCAVADWTDSPIGAGEKGEISVTFDAQMLGSFKKSVTIYSNADPHLTYLYFTGEVVREVKVVKDFSETHPYRIGRVRLSRTELEFPDVYKGDKPVLTIGLVNESDQPYEPILMHLPSFLKMEKDRDLLKKGEEGTLRITLNSERLQDWGLTQTSVYLSRFAGDKVGEENEIPLSVVLLPEIAVKGDGSDAPKIRLSESEINLSKELEQKRKVVRNVQIFNVGKSDLEIYKLQVFHPSIEVRLKSTRLKSGGQTQMKVTIHPDKIKSSQKSRRLRILLITNDPARPKQEISFIR